MFFFIFIFLKKPNKPGPGAVFRECPGADPAAPRCLRGALRCHRAPHPRPPAPLSGPSVALPALVTSSDRPVSAGSGGAPGQLPAGAAGCSAVTGELSSGTSAPLVPPRGTRTGNYPVMEFWRWRGMAAGSGALRGEQDPPRESIAPGDRGDSPPSFGEQGGGEWARCPCAAQGWLLGHHDPVAANTPFLLCPSPSLRPLPPARGKPGVLQLSPVSPGSPFPAIPLQLLPPPGQGEASISPPPILPQLNQSGFPPPGRRLSCACAPDQCCCPGGGAERAGRAGIIGVKFMEQKTTVNIILFVLLLSNKSF